MIKNIVFDIGNVLADFRLVEFLTAKGYSPEIIKRILKASVMSPYWEAFERCDLTEEEAKRKFAELDPELEKEIYEAYASIEGLLGIREYAVDWVKALKEQGFNVYYLSNYSKKAFDECKDSLVFMPYMDGGCLSFQEKMTKPDERFYKRFLEKYNLAAEECIFIDDTPVNVEVAEKIGFKGIIFESYEKTIEAIRKYAE